MDFLVGTPLRVNGLEGFQELQEFHRVVVWSVKFGGITGTKTDTVKFASFAVFLRRDRERKEAGAETTGAHYHARLNHLNLHPYGVLATHRSFAQALGHGLALAVFHYEEIRVSVAADSKSVQM
jgi:hypothetical protein